ncbi:diguanylate cyclase [Shewanella sp. JM162201]|uniref:diguanylate cyclase n=1 Tax=Shewanella jiangmenensis TaxID=2837387 RepID=A0ABS5V5G4_9GAMM|nr:diguanylate cyclase [Shewanella jiangmenensis]MBT1445704.1 diguanylate cyclase [Shewanella jiangmenensis]
MSALLKTSRFRLGLVLAVAGFLLNLYPLPLFANVQLILGNATYVIAAIVLGPRYALVVSLSCAAALYSIWDTGHVWLLFPLEALALAFARRRGIYSLYAGVMFWLLIGMPLFYLYGTQFSSLPEAHVPFVAFKQAINGLFYISLGAILLIPAGKLFKGLINDSAASGRFADKLTYSFSLFISFGLLISALMFNQFFIEKQQILLKVNLDDNAIHLGQATFNYLSEHQRAVSQSAIWLSMQNESPNLRQEWLSKFNQGYPAFLTMLIADRDGHIVAASPASRMNDEAIVKGDYSVADRPYFQEAFYNQKTFVSPVFKGRGFGNDPIIAISAPLYSKQHSSQPVGILEGSLDLTRFVMIDRQNRQHSDQFLLLVDENEMVVYSSKGLDIAPLTELRSAPGGRLYRTELQLLNLHDLNNPNPEYMYARELLPNGWQLYVLQPFAPLMQLAETQFLRTCLLIIAGMLITFYLSHMLSRMLTGSLEAIAEQFAAKDGRLDPLPDDAPTEVQNLYAHLSESKRELRSYQLELEEKVATRTLELERANAQLLTLAERDHLTGLYNRRYAVNAFTRLCAMCERGEEAIAVVLLDLDFFKKINDTHGHLTGDECLRQLASLLQQTFKRECDLAVRFGGEEFLLLLPMTNALNIERHLDNFRERLSHHPVTAPQSQEIIHLSVSIGALVANASFSPSLEAWLKVADENLYRAKAEGRNRVVCTILSGSAEPPTADHR